MQVWTISLMILVVVGGILYVVWRGRRQCSRAGTSDDTTGTAYAKSEGPDSGGHDTGGGGGSGGD
jgi:hypothetical protein